MVKETPFQTINTYYLGKLSYLYLHVFTFPKWINDYTCSNLVHLPKSVTQYGTMVQWKHLFVNN